MVGSLEKRAVRPAELLQGHRVLVVEDEYMLAEDLCSELREAGVIVVGPVGGLAEAIDLIRATKDIDGAILDINVRGEMIFPVADLLSARGTPFVFSTGYGSDDIPARFGHVVLCEKPVNIAKVARTLRRQFNRAR